MTPDIDIRYRNKIHFRSSYYLKLREGLGIQNTPTAPLQRGKIPPTSVLDMTLNKQSDSDVPKMLELWGMPSIPGLLWPGVVPPDRVLSMGQIELNCVAMLNCLK